MLEEVKCCFDNISCNQKVNNEDRLLKPSFLFILKPNYVSVLVRLGLFYVSRKGSG